MDFGVSATWVSTRSWSVLDTFGTEVVVVVT